MTWLRDVLVDLADESPKVDLAELAVAGHRRRRRTALTLTASRRPWRWARGRGVTLPGLPRRPHGHAAARRHGARPARRQGGVAQQRVPDTLQARRPERQARLQRRRVAGGHPHRHDLPGAAGARQHHQGAARTRRDQPGRAHARLLQPSGPGACGPRPDERIRGDLPVTVKEERIGVGSMLVISDDGRYVVFDPREGARSPGY